MPKHYYLLKGTVSQLTVFEDPKEMQADNIGMFAFIGLTLMGLIGSAAALIGSLTSGSVKLEGQGFFCYVGSKRVEGKLVRVGFQDGDYVELIVKRQKTGVYKVYAARVPNQHAFYFPRSVGTPTLELLKYCSIITGILSFLSYIILSIMMFFISNGELEILVVIFEISLLVFFALCIILFFMLGGRYSFLSNKIYAIFGYPKPWLFNSLKEDLRFKKMNRSEDPELFDDPQTPEFKRLTKFTPFAHYYGRTPTVPKWVDVIDEHGISPQSHQNN